jgi:hypothetical protein
MTKEAEGMELARLVDDLTVSQVQLFNKWVESIHFHKMGKKTTVALLTLKGGYEVIGSSSCVNPDDFIYVLGKKYAVIHALSQIAKLDGFNQQLIRSNEA